MAPAVIVGSSLLRQFGVRFFEPEDTGSCAARDRRAGLLALIKMGGSGAADDRRDGFPDELIVMAGLE